MTDVAAPLETPAPTRARGLRPLRSRYVLVVLLPLVALVAVVLWALTADARATASAETYPRSDIPGSITVQPRAGTWFVYAEGATRDFDVEVVAPDGTQVPVRELQAGGVYEIRGTQAEAVASFDVPAMTDTGYTVRAVGSPDPQATFAVGDDDLIGWTRLSQVAGLALLLVNAGAAVAIVVVPIARYRRHLGAVTT